MRRAPWLAAAIRSTIAIAVVSAASVAVSDEAMFPHWKGLSDFRAAWYSEHLRAMGEHALSDSAAGEHVRFLLLPSFQHPVSVRIDCDESCRLVAYQLSGFGGYEPGEISKRVDRRLSPDEARVFNDQLDAANLWSGQPENDAGLDGSQWIVEAQRPEGYVAWDVWSPVGPPFEAFIDLCRLMQRLAALDTKSAEHPQ